MPAGTQYPAASKTSRKVARHRVRDHIARSIATGQYPPGTKLIQEDLAHELGVSRAVVREALFELSGMGLVETSDNCGAVVGQFNLERLLECFELREILEGLAAARCCDRITLRQVRELRDMVLEIYRLRCAGHDADSGRLDREFHLRLTRIAGSWLLERLSNTYAVLGKVATRKKASAQATLKEHQAILDAIQSGDAEAAERSARAHVRKIKIFAQEHGPADASTIQWII